MTSTLGLKMLSVAVFICIGGIFVGYVDAQCSSVTNCMTCPATGPDTGVCSQCQPLNGLQYVDAHNTICTACNQPNSNCTNCTTMSACLKCNSVTTQGPNNGSATCSPCSANCRGCATAGGGKCNQCSPGYLLNTTTQTCGACAANCSGCRTSGNGKCDTCVAGYGVNTTRLCQVCATGCAQCATNVSNCTMCTSTSLVMAKDGSGTCAACAPNCNTCAMSGAGNCDNCTSPYILTNKPSGGGTYCKSNCAPYCANCTVTGAGSCDNCTAPYVLTVNATTGMNYCKGPACPIVPRSQWTSAPVPGSVANLTGPVGIAVFHHTFGGFCFNDSACKSTLLSLEEFQKKNTSQLCIVYNYVIGENGVVYEGRGGQFVGNVTKGYYATALQIAVMGTFTARTPNAAAMAAIDNLLSANCQSIINLSNSYVIYTHYDLECTLCPGPAFRNAMQTKYKTKWGTVKKPCSSRSYLRPSK